MGLMVSLELSAEGLRVGGFTHRTCIYFSIMVDFALGWGGCTLLGMTAHLHSPCVNLSTLGV
jgi:hypothetical protein